jgi:hypothetical protein
MQMPMSNPYPGDRDRRAARACGRVIVVAAAIGVLAGCQATPPPSPAPDTSKPVVPDLEAWPPLAADPALTADARRVCLPDLGVVAGIPFALQDRREAGRAIVVFADKATIAWCTVMRTPQGTVPDGGSGTQDLWTNQVGIVVTPAGLTINDATDATDSSGWSNLSGRLPNGATHVHAAIGGRRVEAAVAAGIYSLSWPGDVIPTLLVAVGPSGDEIARIDEAALNRVFLRECPPLELGCMP